MLLELRVANEEDEASPRYLARPNYEFAEIQTRSSKDVVVTGTTPRANALNCLLRLGTSYSAHVKLLQSKSPVITLTVSVARTRLMMMTSQAKSANGRSRFRRERDIPLLRDRD